MISAASKPGSLSVFRLNARVPSADTILKAQRLKTHRRKPRRRLQSARREDYAPSTGGLPPDEGVRKLMLLPELAQKA